MAQFQQIRPELGRMDFSPIERGGRAFGQGVGQGLASLGAGIGSAIRQKREKEELKQKESLAAQWVSDNYGVSLDDATAGVKSVGVDAVIGVAEQQGQRRDLGAALQALDHAFPATASGDNKFSVPTYLQSFSELGGQDPNIALRALSIGQSAGLIPQEASPMDQAELEKTIAETSKIKAETEQTDVETEQIGAETEQILAETKQMLADAEDETQEPTEFEKKYAQALATSAVEWETKDRVVASQNWSRLDTATKSLEKGLVKTGSFFEKMPFAEATRGRFRENVANLMDQVQGVVYQSLKATLGAQFTEKEAQRLVASYVNPQLDTATNATRLRMLTKGLKQVIDARDAVYDHYRTHRTMQGYDGPDPQAIYDELQSVPVTETSSGNRIKIHKSHRKPYEPAEDNQYSF